MTYVCFLDVYFFISRVHAMDCILFGMFVVCCC